MSKSVAVVGASKLRSKFGNKSVRAHLHAGYQVFPVNIHPSDAEIEGLAVYHRLSEIPGPIHRVTMYLPPAITLELLPEIAAVRPLEVWFNPGSHSPTVLARAAELGLPAIEGCSIVDLGVSPADFPD
ncbi:MAG: CoA-binding protein [Deltaproteobacteria bacterium]|nr:CoA-binding protein [Deltaproteobacteria bacterium]